MSENEESYLASIRRIIEEEYEKHPTGCGSSFGEILCWELHENGKTFTWLAQDWGISVTTLGELIYDHCKRLEELPVVRHKRITKVAELSPNENAKEEEVE